MILVKTGGIEEPKMREHIRYNDNKEYGYTLTTPIGVFQSFLYPTYAEGQKIFARSLSNCIERMAQQNLCIDNFHDLKGRTYLECLKAGEYCLPDLTCQFCAVPSHGKE